jgi:hypothetical protein
MYNTSLEYNPATPPPTTEQIINYLLFWQALEQSDSSYLETHISNDVRLTTLMKVFLISEDAFLEPMVQQAIMSIFQNLTNENSKLNTATMVGPKFTGFLEDFVSQFSAVSYGSAAFASILFIFLRTEFPHISCSLPFTSFYNYIDIRNQFRKKIWSELFEMLPLLANSQQFPLGITGYLFPIETHSDVLNLYINALVNVCGSVNIWSGNSCY